MFWLAALSKTPPGDHNVVFCSTTGQTWWLLTGQSPDAAGSYVVLHRGVLAATLSRCYKTVASSMVFTHLEQKEVEH